MRYLGLDLGSKTLGISISDKLGMIARSLTIIKNNKRAGSGCYCSRISKKYE